MEGLKLAENKIIRLDVDSGKDVKEISNLPSIWIFFNFPIQYLSNWIIPMIKLYFSRTLKKIKYSKGGFICTTGCKLNKMNGIFGKPLLNCSKLFEITHDIMIAIQTSIPHAYYTHSQIFPPLQI